MGPLYKSGVLSKVEKKFNKVIAHCRVLSERTIAGIKRLRCVADVFRSQRVAMADTFMELACGIWNLHLKNGRNISSIGHVYFATPLLIKIATYDLSFLVK